MVKHAVENASAKGALGWITQTFSKVRAAVPSSGFTMCAPCCEFPDAASAEARKSKRLTPAECGMSIGQSIDPMARIVLAPEVSSASAIPCAARIAPMRSNANPLPMAPRSSTRPASRHLTSGLCSSSETTPRSVPATPEPDFTASIMVPAQGSNRPPVATEASIAKRRHRSHSSLTKSVSPASIALMRLMSLPGA